MASSPDPVARHVNLFLQRVFLSTTNPVPPNPKWIFLPRLAAELRKPVDAQPPPLTVDCIDRILVERWTIDSSIRPVIFLCQCYRLCGEEAANPLYKNHLAALQPVIVQCRKVVVNFLGLALRYPDSFPRCGGATDLEAAMIPPEGGCALVTSDLLDALVANITETRDELSGAIEGADMTRDDPLQLVFRPLVDGLFARLRRNTDICCPDFAALSSWRLMAECRPLGDMITRQEDIWNPPDLTTGVQMQECTVLGRLLSLSALPQDRPDVAGTMFPNPLHVSRAEMDRTSEQLASTLRNWQERAGVITKKILMASDGARERCQDWFGRFLTLNEPRTKVRGNLRDAAPDSVTVNLTAVLLALAGPFTRILDSWNHTQPLAVSWHEADRQVPVIRHSP
ncbi:hypothetical protein PAPYR_2792 [Paratrimastix pyriformis]|uniref:Ubiquitin conjugation factor E4 core domain-containing protein n=1 Tax=Paratrimastix pyriformis TaxID=342808 RepID=A0ABQ8UP63_9EUKA|nr:hypothetical protein PAPYR_2792 [Paratrimastix pyriformis]